MCAIEVTGAFPDPHHVGRAVVPVAREGVLTRQGLFVPEDEGLVRGVEIDLVELSFDGGVESARRHESQRPVDPCGNLVVTPALRRGGDELLIPGVDSSKVSETALGERPQQIQG